jgi:hypothetical protein
MEDIRTIPTPFEEVRRASAVDGGTAISDSAVLIALPRNADWVSVVPHEFVGASVAQISLNPWLTIIKTADLLASPGVEHSNELQDGDTTDVALDAWNTLANGHALYVGSWLPFRGCRVVVGSDPNNTASVLTVKYWKPGGWTDINDTDGTIQPAGTTFGQNGDVTWTIPATWTADSLKNIGDVAAPDTQFRSDFETARYTAPLYWTRWEVSAVTEATWNVAAIQPLNRSTNYPEYAEGFGFQQALDTGPDGFSCVEALLNAGDGKLIVNVATKYKKPETRRFGA